MWSIVTARVNVIRMLKKLLISNHSFFYHSHNGSMSHPIMPVISVSLTIYAFLAGTEMILNEGRVLSFLDKVHPLLVVAPTYVLIIMIYLFYKNHLPSNKELRGYGKQWFGVFLCITSVLYAMFCSLN